MRVAPRTTELLVERGEYVPGQGVPLFELRPPIFAGAEWATKRVFDVVVGALIVVARAAGLAADRAADQAHLARPGALSPIARIGLGERPFRMLKFRTMVTGAAEQQAALEEANEATGALFKIRDDPRVTRVGRLLRRLSIDELPNLINVLRGEMSLVGPRPLPLRDYDAARASGTAAATTSCRASPASGRSPAAPTSPSTTSCGSTSTTSRTGRSGSTSRSSSRRRGAVLARKGAYSDPGGGATEVSAQTLYLRPAIWVGLRRRFG